MCVSVLLFYAHHVVTILTCGPTQFRDWQLAAVLPQCSVLTACSQSVQGTWTCLLVVIIFKQIVYSELEAQTDWAPRLPFLQNCLVVGKHAIKDCPILKGENALAMLLLMLPFSLIAGTCGVVQCTIAMPLPIFECALISAMQKRQRAV